MNVKNILQELGLGEQEATLYLALLRLGESSVGPIIEASGMHREVVYRMFQRLEHQGLVQSYEKKKIRYYQALDPVELVKKAQSKVDLANSILPDLRKLLHQVPLSVKIYEGSEGYEEVQKDIQFSLKDNEEYYVIGGSGSDFYEVTKDFYRRYRKKCIERGISQKLLTFKNEAKGILNYEVPGFCKVRIMPTHFAVPSSTKIYADKIIIQVFGETPVAIMIRSEAVSSAYKQFFRLFWKMGIPVK